MQRGYTLLWRKCWDNPVLHERNKRFSKFEAWFYMVNVLARGVDDPVTGLKRGQFEASVRFLSRAWLWSTGSVHAFLKELVKSSMISRVEHFSEHFSERFTICEYDTYNKPVNTLLNDNLNKVKEGKKERIKAPSSQAAVTASMDPSPSAESIRLSDLLRTAIAERDPHSQAARLPDATRWARDIDKLLRLDGRRAEDVEAVIMWCQRDPFWAPNILSGRKLREKFDQLYGKMKSNGTNRNYKPDLVGQNDDSGPADPAWVAEVLRKKQEALCRLPASRTGSDGKPKP